MKCLAMIHGSFQLGKFHEDIARLLGDRWRSTNNDCRTRNTMGKATPNPMGMSTPVSSRLETYKKNNTSLWTGFASLPGQHRCGHGGLSPAISSEACPFRASPALSGAAREQNARDRTKAGATFDPGMKGDALLMRCRSRCQGTQLKVVWYR